MATLTDNISISKKKLWIYINKKLNYAIHSSHTLAIITILFDEILKDLKAGKSLKIINFGELKLKPTPKRKYFNGLQKKVMISRGYKLIRFKMTKEISSIICKKLDFDKTFPT